MITKITDAYFENYRGITLTAWKGITVGLLESALIGVCYFLSLYFVHELDMSVVCASAMLSFYGIGTITGSATCGKLSDLINPNLVSAMNLLLQSIAFACLTFITSPYILGINLFVMGFASYGFITSNHTWILSKCMDDEAQRLKAINLIGVASNLGLGLAAIIISFINVALFTKIFFIASTLLFSLAVYILWQDFSSKLISEKNNKLSTNPIKNHSSKHINKTLIWYTLTCLFISGIIISQTSCTYSIYLQSKFPEMGVKSFSILFFINTLMVVALQAPIANRLTKCNKVITTGLSASLIAFGMFILAYPQTYGIAVIACILMTLGEIVFFSMSFSICYEAVNSNKKGQAIGLYRLVYALSRIVGPLIGGTIYTAFSGEALWLLCGSLGFVIFVITLFYTNTTPQEFSIRSEQII